MTQGEMFSDLALEQQYYNMIKQLNKIDIIKISIVRDGGTSVWIEPSIKAALKTIDEADACQKYYLDNRIGSTTKGELYDRYPNEDGAVILDKTKFNFL